MKTRAVASSPTSAMASAASENGRFVPIDGMIAAAQIIVPNTMYGAERNSGDACSASTASLRNSLRMLRYGSQMLGGVRFCSTARHCATQPANSGAASSATSTSMTWVSHVTPLIGRTPGARAA